MQRKFQERIPFVKKIETDELRAGNISLMLVRYDIPLRCELATLYDGELATVFSAVNPTFGGNDALMLVAEVISPQFLCGANPAQYCVAVIYHFRPFPDVNSIL